MRLFLTAIIVFYYIQSFLPDIFFLFLLIWGIAGIVTKRKKIYNVLSLVFVNIGTISRLLCSIGYFGWNPNVLSSDLFNIFYTETYSFWIVGWVFVIGVWTDVIGASKLEIALKRAPIIILLVEEFYLLSFK